ncbi:hypothetical protein HMPREF1141_3173 [Clostridium sp. MSTE9]|nr:hypothetical protein HMPREF1141_3173 [Clostridium sp. MSTE9]
MAAGIFIFYPLLIYRLSTPFCYNIYQKIFIYFKNKPEHRPVMGKCSG